MSGHGYFSQGPVTASLNASGTVYFPFPVGQTPYQSFQLVCYGTGSTSGLIQLETTNVSDNKNSDGPTTVQYLWNPEPSGTMPAFTGSTGKPTSQLVHIGNLGSRYARVRADLGPGLWALYKHGKA